MAGLLGVLALDGWLWLAPPASQDPPGGGEINWLLDAPWAKVALLITLAVGVMFLANARMRSRRGRGGIKRPDFDLRVARLEALPPTAIADAKSGDVHLVGTLVRGEGALGTGPRACVYQNRAKSSRATAIAAELVLVEDETGIVGVEGLEAARVIAPKEDHGAHDTIALYLGDRVEVLGELMLFEAAHTIQGKQMRGMMGSLSQIQVRMIERAERAESRAQADADIPPGELPTQLPNQTSEAP